MTFRGFPPEAISFYEGLAADNSKSYWQAHKATYENAVKGPMLALTAELPEYGPFRIFRPFNDVRFSKTKAPYKLNIAALAESEGGSLHYVSVAADGLTVGSGYYHMAADQLERFRRAVDAEATGAEVDRLCRELEEQGFTIGAIDELKTAPRGYPKDHPRIALLRRKGLTALRTWPVAKWLHTKAVVDRLRSVFEAAAPLDAWLDAHVGPSTLPPPDFGR